MILAVQRGLFLVLPSFLPFYAVSEYIAWRTIVIQSGRSAASNGRLAKEGGRGSLFHSPQIYLLFDHHWIVQFIALFSFLCSMQCKLFIFPPISKMSLMGVMHLKLNTDFCWGSAESAQISMGNKLQGTVVMMIKKCRVMLTLRFVKRWRQHQMN